MPTGTESGELRLDEPFDEIAEGLALALANSLRWLAANPHLSATLLIEAFVRNGELRVVADMPRQPAPDRRERRRTNGRRPGCGPRGRALHSSHDRSLRVFALPLVPPGE